MSPVVGNVPLGKTGMGERVVVGGEGSEPRICQGPVGRDWEEEMGGVRKSRGQHRAGGKKGGRDAGHREVNRTALPPLQAGPAGEECAPATDFPFPKVPWKGEGAALNGTVNSLSRGSLII